MAKCKKPYWKFTRSGKNGDIYESADGKFIAIVRTDRLSVGDIPVPGKGVPGMAYILTHVNELITQVVELSGVARTAAVNYWANDKNKKLYEDFEAETGRDIDATTIQLKGKVIPIECIGRYHLGRGSAKRAYDAGKRSICGETMPDGMKESDKFPQLLYTPTQKTDKDEPLNGDEIENENTDVEWLNMNGYNGEELAPILRQLTILVGNVMSDFFASYGLILADYKVEFAYIVPEDGSEPYIALVDECGTPACVRLWLASEWESGKAMVGFDKELLRKDIQDQRKLHRNDAEPTPEAIAQTLKLWNQLEHILGLDEPGPHPLLEEVA